MPLSTPTMMTITTRWGAKSFTTSLEWAEAIEILRKIASEGNDFATSLLDREDKGKYMSDSQINWVYKLAQDDLNSREMDNKLEGLETKKTIDASNILASVCEANAKGIKKPVLRLVMPDGAKVKVKYMTSGRIAGGAWITINDDLRGKITDQGEFEVVGYNHPEGFVNTFEEFITSVNSNVQGAIVEYGRITSSCGCCGLPLTNAQSIALGIGPICLDKYGLR